MTTADSAHQPHLSLVETPPLPPSAASPTGRRAWVYSETAERKLTDPDWQPRHSTEAPQVLRPFRLPATRN